MIGSTRQGISFNSMLSARVLEERGTTKIEENALEGEVTVGTRAE